MWIGNGDKDWEVKGEVDNRNWKVVMELERINWKGKGGMGEKSGRSKLVRRNRIRGSELDYHYHYTNLTFVRP